MEDKKSLLKDSPEYEDYSENVHYEAGCCAKSRDGNGCCGSKNSKSCCCKNKSQQKR
ncbi:hypothetical protein [Clostridium polynesiense]|uniref:hypothetical protein n=1 Tax=Clostridium polynesiense TaxID=1325933 RepID=UPI000B28703A|nr:hypothetical protein [Clostridium polynesiense]